jgi:subtilisin family serine protease
MTGMRGCRTAAFLLVSLVCTLCVASPARADAVRDRCWYLDYLHIAQAQQFSTGAGVTVAVVDTGVNPDQPELDGQVLKGIDSGRDFTGDGRKDIDGHGTTMASLIAGHGRGVGGRDGILGVAPGVKILPIDAESIDVGPAKATASGVSWAIDQGAKVVSLSVATDNAADVWGPVVAKALARDVVLVAAMGNRPDRQSPGAPAVLPGVLAVTALNELAAVPDWALTDRRTVIAAPGAKIPFVKADGTYTDRDGTSPATAIIAGVVALIRAKYPQLSAAEVVHRLEATATDAGDPGRDDVYGYGIVNPLAALTEDVPPLSATPTAKAGSGNGLSGRTTTILVLGGLAVIVLLAAGAVGVAVALRRR